MHPSTLRPVSFYFRGRVQHVQPASIQLTVLQWLREDQRACGTKEGCNEGDCGACTVVLGELDEAGGLRLRAVNACLLLLPALDGRALFVVEDVSALAPDGGLHPLQAALVAAHGSQCGFCTPGFVMSLWADYENRADAPTRAELEDTLAGNLCRCTGYRPILEAAQRARQMPRLPLERAPVIAALRELALLPPLQLSDGRAHWHAPHRLEALAELLIENPQARLIAGGTDLGLWVTKQLRELGDLVSLGALPVLRRIVREPGGGLFIGAAARLQDAFAALVADYPELAELARRFASPPIRNAGTVGGNIANGSPIGDTMPALLALDARLLLRHGTVERELPLHAFYLGYQRKDLAPGEFLLGLRLPPRPSGLVLRAYKLAKRYDQDISTLCFALAFELDEQRRMGAVRSGWGGMAAVPRRAPAVEAALEGAPCEFAAFEAAARAVAAAFTPLSDLRGSSGYRLQAAANLLRRAGLELTAGPGDEPPLRLAALKPLEV